MNLPFSQEQFLEVFKRYNLFTSPLQIVFYIFAVLIIFLSIKQTSPGSKIICALLGFFWIWMGAVYHIGFFSSINKAAWLFGFIFINQGVLFFLTAFPETQFRFKLKADIYGITGITLVVFALLIYPVLNYMTGHAYPASPTFGLPCPTTIFTFGVLLWADKRLPLLIIIIPILWSVVGFSAAFSLGMKEDISLLAAAIISFILLVRKNGAFSFS